MRKLRLTLTALMFAAFVGLALFGVGSVRAQPGPVATPQLRRNPQAGQMGPETGAKQSVRTFQGIIEQEGGQYVLDSGGVTYHLSDQATAKKFSGKAVVVKGTLSTATDTIEVLSITAG